MSNAIWRSNITALVDAAMKAIQSQSTTALVAARGRVHSALSA
jgi:hypothetical protein